MKNNDEIKQANRKALPKFLLIMLASLIAGGVLGFAAVTFLVSAGEDSVQAALTAAGTAFARGAAPWLLAACAAGQLVCGLAFTRKAGALVGRWDGEDEAVSAQAERTVSIGLWISSLLMVAAFFLFAAFYSGGVGGAVEGPVRFFGTLAAFLALLALTILFQQRYVDLTKRLNPEKKGSVYDIKFKKEWFAQCDEAERAQIGQCAWRAYNVMNGACLILWMVFTLTGLLLGTGFLPPLTVCAVWAAGLSAYSIEGIRQQKRG